MDSPALPEELEKPAAPVEEVTSTWGRSLVTISDVVDRFTRIGFVALTAAFASVMLVGVFFRYVLNNSLPWSDEVALIIFAWAMFLSISSAYLHDKHVNIDLVVNRLPLAWKRPVDVLAEGIAGGYLLSLTLGGLQALDLSGRSHTDVLRLPMTVPYMAIPFACILMDIHWVRRNLASGSPSRALLKLAIALGFIYLVALPIGKYVEVSGATRGALLVTALFGPMLIGVPVALCLGFMATVYLGVFGTTIIPLTTGALQIFYGINQLALMAVPLLILSGRLMHQAGMARAMVDFAQAVIGRIRGGLGASDVLASYLFGDISGSTISDTAAIGSLMIPQMKARGYRADFCAALQGASGTLAMLAPLSITILLYASATNTSVSRLAAATIAPATLVAFTFMGYALVHARIHNYPRESMACGELPLRTLRAMPGLVALTLVIGGILGGVFTPAEVGSVLLFMILLLSIFLYHTAQPRRLYDGMIEAGYISAMTLFMVSTSSFLGWMLARDLVSNQLVDLASQISMNRFVVIFVLSVVFIVLGMFLEPPAMIFGFLPSFMPMLAKAGVDQVWWGVLFCVNMGLGQLIPPVAVNLFISHQLAEVSYERAVRAALPFIAVMVADIVLMALFPQIPLMLPHILFDYPIP